MATGVALMSVIVPLDTEDFRVESDANGVARIVLGRAGEMPTLGPRGHAEMARIWRVLDERPDVRCILVCSDGRGFCAGGSLDLVEEMIRDTAVRARVMRESRELVNSMLDCDKPIVSATNGAAVGAGLCVALLADISIAANDAKLLDGHTRIGVTAGDHAALIWPLLCGIARAKQALLLCQSITGVDAERMGLVSRCVDSNDLRSTAQSVAAELARGSAQALAGTKRSLNHWLRSMLPVFEYSLLSEALSFGDSDVVEGIRATRERRPPQFR
jgi:enoyl-CoA hydratase